MTTASNTHAYALRSKSYGTTTKTFVHLVHQHYNGQDYYWTIQGPARGQKQDGPTSHDRAKAETNFVKVCDNVEFLTTYKGSMAITYKGGLEHFSSDDFDRADARLQELSKNGIAARFWSWEYNHYERCRNHVDCSCDWDIDEMDDN